MLIKPFRKKKIVIVTGGFDPLHAGHIEYLKAASLLGDELHVGINSNEWLTRKKGQPFMDISDRYAIISQLKFVTKATAFTAEDDEDGSAKTFIMRTLSYNPKAEIIFANGGDRNSENIPEMEIASNRLSFEFSVGGDDKKNSSSTLLENWKKPKTIRNWGWYRVLDEGIDSETGLNYKLKELVITPGSSLSNQRHHKRSEIWIQVQGKCVLNMHRGLESKTLSAGENSYTIPKKAWHQAYNPFDEPSHTIELQIGAECIEEDIERTKDSKRK